MARAQPAPGPLCVCATLGHASGVAYTSAYPGWSTGLSVERGRTVCDSHILRGVCDSHILRGGRGGGAQPLANRGTPVGRGGAAPHVSESLSRVYTHTYLSLHFHS